MTCAVRPPLLLRAARMGAQDYDRDKHLARILPDWVFLTDDEIRELLIEKESAVNEDRLLRSDAYSVVRHLDLLIAIFGTAQTGGCGGCSPHQNFQRNDSRAAR